MMQDPIWQPGDPILIRHASEDRVWYARPETVVRDEGSHILSYMQAGTPTIQNLIDFETGEFHGPEETTWKGNNILRFWNVGATHTVSLVWEAASGAFKYWYVDLQEPLRRSADGLVSWDRSLDIVVAPDRTWKWKDEDHFQRIQELRWLTSNGAQRLRAEGERVIANIERGDEPFCVPWPDWKPNADWPIPGLPPNWADVPPKL